MTFVVRDDCEHRGNRLLDGRDHVAGLQLLGRHGQRNVGYSLYGRFNDSTGDNHRRRAYTVSFDRPYADGAVNDGAGDAFNWDFPMVKWMESQGSI